MTLETWKKNITLKTENYLTRRKAKKIRKKEKKKKKNVILDWIEAFLWAAVVVLLINQYLFQAYQIPSRSMMNTLLIGDRIFVNKLIFGPELIPGSLKISGFREPRRGEVIIFENPTYISKGPAFDVVQRLIYMLTLSMVDIDRDEEGNPRPHFLIKRAVGVGGDRIRMNLGKLEIKPQGEKAWYPESSFTEYAGLNYPVRRLAETETIDFARYSGLRQGYRDADADTSSLNIPVPDSGSGPPESFVVSKGREEGMYQARPDINRYTRAFWISEMGWYIPEDRIFPLGDNRDNSRDARYFGPVAQKKVLGRAMFRYWPPGRIGEIK
ncbi:MAG: signal peptidase I [Spirochaetia bacterium]